MGAYKIMIMARWQKRSIKVYDMCFICEEDSFNWF